MLNLDGYTEEFLEKEIIDAVQKCWNCNFCYSACPLNEHMEGFMINGPSGLTQAIYYSLKWGLLEGPEREELLKILYTCTTCNNCVIACKDLSAGISILRIIENARKLLSEKSIGPLPTQRSILKSLQLKGNPYNLDPADRLNWADNRDDLKMLPQNRAETLFFVGCVPAYDVESQVIAKRLTKILKTLNIDFGVLENENCCGCTAKWLGDEFLFQDLSAKNIQQFVASGAASIVTTSPHCYNTFVNEYRNIGSLKILHYTQFLARLIEEKSLVFNKPLNYRVTYHDPCYLGRHNGIYEEPRTVLKAIPGLELLEMGKNRKDSLCCGGGGGRMWADIDEEERMGEVRVKQALAIGADVLAVACPWCHTMLRNSVKDLDVQDKIRVMDISELVSQALD